MLWPEETDYEPAEWWKCALVCAANVTKRKSESDPGLEASLRILQNEGARTAGMDHQIRRT